jgi:thioredoxin reductase (NADPH)
MDIKLSNITDVKRDNGAVEKVMILGSGPAGLSAALYAARADLKPVVLSGIEHGGQVSLTYIVENYPGFPEGVGGHEMVELFQKQAERFGARIVYDTATEVDLSKQPFRITTYNGEYLAESLIIATGATPVHLNVPGEVEFTGRGVSYCATCDGWFFKGKDVIVVGGGDSALEEAIFLTRYANSISIVHRRDELRAGAILQKRAMAEPKIKFIWNTIVTEIIGDEGVKSVHLKNVETGEERDHPIDGVFIFIGHHPNSQIFDGQLALDNLGYIVTDTSMKTSVPGVFVAGEVGDPVYRQVVTSAGMGAAAAMQATRFLERAEEEVTVESP